MSWADYEEMNDRLDALGDYETVTPFAYAYYGLIAEYLWGEERAAEGLRLRLLEFFEVVGRYHRALAVFTSQDQVTLGNVRSAAEKRDIGLRVLLEQLNVEMTSGNAEVARLLLSAECYYQLALADRVVERLEAAVDAGADDPLVHFALGYNRYELATQAFTYYDAESGERRVDDHDRYRLACLSAVSSFQQGLSGNDFDAHLHWWIGNVLESAGFAEAAEASFRKAKRMMRAIEQQAAEHGSLELDLETNRNYEYDSTIASGPITEEEVRQVRMLLRRSYNQTDLLDD